VTEREREKERERNRERNRETQTDTDRQTDREQESRPYFTMYRELNLSIFLQSENHYKV